MQAKLDENAKVSCLIVIPTYRERNNIELLQGALAKQGLSYHLLVIDDGSDDGTQQVLQQLQIRGAPITVFQRHKKLGLGTAYVLGFAYAAEMDRDYTIQMDADFSHDPSDIPKLISACKKNDFVIGSRYVAGGGSEGWPWRRRMLSRAANWLARSLLHLDVADVTGGFKCLQRSLLRKMPLERLTVTGFAFQWDFNRLAAAFGAKVAEVPICFRERTTGDSKMSFSIMIEGFWRLLWIRYQGRRQARTREGNGE